MSPVFGVVSLTIRFAGFERQNRLRLQKSGRPQIVDHYTAEERLRLGRGIARRQTGAHRPVTTQLFAVDRRSVRLELRQYEEDQRNRYRYDEY